VLSPQRLAQGEEWDGRLREGEGVRGEREPPPQLFQTTLSTGPNSICISMLA